MLSLTKLLAESTSLCVSFVSVRPKIAERNVRSTARDVHYRHSCAEQLQNIPGPLHFARKSRLDTRAYAKWTESSELKHSGLYLDYS